jgi:thiol-disulfide isomerase/thioredoxin
MFKSLLLVAFLAQTSYVHVVKNAEQKAELDRWKGVTVVMNYAEWCHYCHEMMPILDELSVTYQYQVEFFNVDVDALKIKTNGVPVITISGGKKKPMVVDGSVPKETMEQAIKEYLAD